MNATLHDLLNDLIHAEIFDAAAEVVLRVLLQQAGQVLRSGPFGQSGRMLRGMVHLRPEGGYRGLVVLEEGDDRCSVPQEDSMLPSSTVWRLVESRRCQVSVDVMLAQVTPLGGQPIPMDQAAARAAGPGAATSSQSRLLGREATHLFVLPLRPSGSEVAGMISLEANCPQAMGMPFIWPECAEVLQIVSDLATPYLLSRPLRQPRRSAYPVDELLPVVGPSMEALINLLRVFAQHDETVLLSGQTGTGKTRLARWCHAHSPRRERPFEIANLNTMPPGTQMGELFGWRKGAFTGAVSDHVGWVGQAEGGTLFLDEIDKLSLDAQAGLLHLLEERRYRVLGDGAATRKADVRFLIGTNTDLRAAVREGRFREDLYYRINVLPVHLPPLCERSDEIREWAAYMLMRRHREAGLGGSAQLSGDAGLALMSFPWPGNLRQLDNVIRRAYAMAMIDWAGPVSSIELGRQHIERAMAFERDLESGSLAEGLRQAARAYAIEAERRLQRDAPPLGLELAEAFPGFVLSAAVTLTGSRKGAFHLYGLSQMVDNRNHHKAFERAAKKVMSALAASGEPADAELEAQLSVQSARNRVVEG